MEENNMFHTTGWNSWNHFGCGINETIVQQTADAIVSTGLAAAGYQYGRSFLIFYIQKSQLFFIDLAVNIDDCWQQSRDNQGTIQPDPNTFPSGIPALADYVHSKKLKFGLYSGKEVIASICYK